MNAVAAKYGNLELKGRMAFVAGAEVRLTGNELGVLSPLVEAAGQVVSKEQILRFVYGAEAPPASNVLQVCAARLRKKLHAAGADVVLVNVRARGYMLELVR